MGTPMRKPSEHDLHVWWFSTFDVENCILEWIDGTVSSMNRAIAGGLKMALPYF